MLKMCIRFAIGAELLPSLGWVTRIRDTDGCDAAASNGLFEG
jgi:hypothetical protein